MGLTKKQNIELCGLLGTAVIDNSARPQYERLQANEFIKILRGMRK